MEVLTRKYGPLPAWAWAALAGAAALAFWYVRGRSSSAASQSGQAGLVNNPAASSIPYVPSVTVTGIPQQAPNIPATSSSATGSTLTAGSSNPNLRGQQIPLYQSMGGTMKSISSISFGTKLTPSGTPVQAMFGSGQGPALFIPISAPIPGFVSQDDVTWGSGGQGGWGYAGQPSYASAIGGWTIGWSPWGGQGGDGMGGGAGGPSSVNRTRTARPKVPRFVGGQGGAGRSGHPAPAGRPNRRRTFSGR